MKKPRRVAKQMLEEKEAIQAYLKDNDEAKRPKGVRLIDLIPESACKSKSK